MGLYDQKLGTMLYDAGGAVINIRNPKYNAKPDGSTNNTTAFANALTDLQAAGGGTLFIPAGPNFYDIPGGINMNVLTVPVVVCGQGYGSWLHASATEWAILLNGLSNIRLENFRFTGSVTNIIDLFACSNIQISNLHLSGTTRPATAGVVNAAIFMNSGNTDIVLDRLMLSGNGYIEAGSGNPLGYEILSHVNADADNIRITRCKILGSNTQSSIVLYNVNNSIIDSNRIDQGNHGAASGAGMGIQIYQGSGTHKLYNRVIGNRISNCANNGIYLAGTDYANISGNAVSNVANYGISLADCDNSVCATNVIVSAQYGIEIDNSNDVIVSGNRIVSCPGYGVLINGAACSNIVVQGNRINGSNTGIIENAPSTNCSIVDNDVTGCANPLNLGASPSGICANNQGSNTVPIFAVSTTVSKHHDIILGYAASGPITITLPDWSLNVGREIVIKKVDASSNVVTVNSIAGVIDSAATFTGLDANFKWIRVVAGYDRWWIIAKG